MAGNLISRGFTGRRPTPNTAARLPPGQYLTDDFPVLSAGPTPHTPLAAWTFTVEGLARQPGHWSWAEFTALPGQSYVADIHCVTKWSRLDTHWRGISVETLLDHVGVLPSAHHVLAFCDGGYTTNIPLPDLRDGKGFVAFEYEGRPLEPEHGGPARLVVPHLYFWKSAKWIRGLRLIEQDELGFWERYGYHSYGDPWREQRYQGD